MIRSGAPFGLEDARLKAVDDVATLPLTFDDCSAFQNPKVVGYGHDFGVKRFTDLADVLRTAPQAVDDSQSNRIAQRPQLLGTLFGLKGIVRHG